MERWDRNLVWPNELQVVWVMGGWMVGFLTVTGGKKEGRGRKRGVVHLLWPLSGDHHHQKCEMETGHRNDLTNQNKEYRKEFLNGKLSKDKKPIPS